MAQAAALVMIGGAKRILECSSTWGWIHYRVVEIKMVV